MVVIRRYQGEVVAILRLQIGELSMNGPCYRLSSGW